MPRLSNVSIGGTSEEATLVDGVAKVDDTVVRSWKLISTR
jgi:hypothetical protein